MIKTSRRVQNYSNYDEKLQIIILILNPLTYFQIQKTRAEVHKLIITLKENSAFPNPTAERTPLYKLKFNNKIKSFIVLSTLLLYI